MNTSSHRSYSASICLWLVGTVLGTGASSARASDYTTQAYIGAADSGPRTNQTAAVDVAAPDGGPLRVTTWQGQPGDQLGHALVGPGALSMFLHAQGGKNNSIGGRCLLEETFVARDSSRPGQPLEVDLVVAFTGSETGPPGASGGYPRADGGAAVIVSIPYQGGVSTNVWFFGLTNLTVSAVRSHRFGMVEGVPLRILGEFELNVTTTGALGEDEGITADFDARLFVRPADATVSLTSASGYAYALPSTLPTNIEPRATTQALRLSWPVDHRGWRLVMNTNGCDGDCFAGRWFNVFGAAYTNDIVIPINPALRTRFYQLVWP